MTYFFLLGSTPDLSFAELQSLVGYESLQRLSPLVVAMEADSDEVATEFFQILGGSVKLLKQEGEFVDINQETLFEYVVAYLAQTTRPTFAIAEFNRDNLPKLDVNKLKQSLKTRGQSARFIEGSRSGLSASILLHHPGVIELNIIQLGSKILFARTLAVQDIDNWTVRDRQKPYFDRKKGMLPPKIARIMVNLGIGSIANRETGALLSVLLPTNVSVYDPFCGSGTILIEAMVRNCHVIGSDLDPMAATGTEKNLNWFQQEVGSPAQSNLKKTIFVADATSVTLAQLGQPVDLIVTEPFLGKPTPNPAQLENMFRGLEKLYIGSFKNWTHLLRPQGTVVIVFPYVKDGIRIYSLENIIDKLSQFGYTPVSEPSVYHRPQAVVQRQIWTFAYQGNKK